ncbi:hypothetical protein RG959_13215 [Domibacillus sp. 8LH]|uniref:hypothetical protein n=1 Tax=Domibacillus TaxID=1433999 RepID=UPI001F567595|nr:MULTISPECIES: hypothetical protein [Domibacillus]MCI2254024.1 hypothetical protein [Domibacillus sp. PGB-M46]MCM3789483.1 hypothetical protein [Domibacillus indicus]WNS79318.1 hypothetical protein RRU94_17375 [Domibacillus sp. DTU_2020_1001157_1_SI_ALB_TIR_016]
MGKRRGIVLIEQTERNSMNRNRKNQRKLHPFNLQRQMNSIFVPLKKGYRPNPP